MKDSAQSKGSGHGSRAMPVEEARARILAAVTAIERRERVAVRDALHRVLAHSVSAAVDVPAHTNSAMDGYALRAADAAGESSRLHLIGESFAGHPFAGSVEAGSCVRIMTGAVLPQGADSVVMQERTNCEGDDVVIDGPVKHGANVRAAGEDVARGDTVLGPGRWLTAADIGVLASVGAAEVEVLRRPRVAFFSTGDELRSIGQPLGPGQIYDSNRYTLYGMLREQGVELIDLGVVPDDPAALEQAFAAAADCDAILTSGGVSVGAADYVVDILKHAGDVGFWQVAIKPGRPLAFGRIGRALFFGLPGNPVSVMVTFRQLVAPALVRLAGSTPAPMLQLRLRSTAAIDKKPGRKEFQRGRLIVQDGELAVAPFGHQGSGVLRSMSEADCFIVLEIDDGDAAAGDTVTVEPFAQPLWNGPRAG